MRLLNSLVLLLLVDCGFLAAATPPRADATPRTFGKAPHLRYLILGDSTAVSVGGNYENGFAVATANHLAERHGGVELVNVAVSGARIADVRREQLPRADLATADVVLIAAGANDVVHLTRSSSFDRDFRSVVDTILARNCRAKVIVTGAPDMSTPPRIPRLLRPLAGYRTRRLNVIVRRIAAERGLTFAPIADQTGPLFRVDRSLFSDDRFHPNDRGYATWSDVLRVSLDEAFARQQSRCR